MDTWYAVYDIASGALLSVGTVVADPLPDGLAVVDVGTQRPAGAWNATTHAFDAAAVEKPVLQPIDFLRRFTFAEEVGIRTAAKTDVGIEVFLARLSAAREVRLDHPDTVAGMGYLELKGLISAARVAEILA